jgi:hypothetical protein
LVEVVCVLHVVSQISVLGRVIGNLRLYVLRD